MSTAFISTLHCGKNALIYARQFGRNQLQQQLAKVLTATTATTSLCNTRCYTYWGYYSINRQCGTDQWKRKYASFPLQSLPQFHCLPIAHTINNNGPCRSYATKSTKSDGCGKTDGAKKRDITVDDADLLGEASNLGLFAKFKLMYKKYWYVLIPVHIVTSIGWFGGFYYLSKSGVDVASLLQYMHLSESIIEKVQGSKMGHLAIAYLCYKVATPLRYAVTLGGTTVSIKYLVQAGHIKPLPSKKQIIKMYEDKRAKNTTSKQDKENHNGGIGMPKGCPDMVTTTTHSTVPRVVNVKTEKNKVSNSWIKDEDVENMDELMKAKQLQEMENPKSKNLNVAAKQTRK